MIELAFFINLRQIKVQALFNNANINYGPTYQNSHTSNNTIIGGNFAFGDGSINSFTNSNSGKINVSNANTAQES
ncbi:spore germination protein [Bacillus sp. FJAT-29814]|uniref:spore germination protein n=1 Tax=Bacillus sp. FJAT-29814 TaxID=1729688 RepID=UPI0008334E4D|nr:spore germination protein [Bacillus sp. FJAT-29814]